MSTCYRTSPGTAERPFFGVTMTTEAEPRPDKGAATDPEELHDLVVEHGDAVYRLGLLDSWR